MDQQNLGKVFKLFRKSSQYLKQEYASYKNGFNFVDISIGLKTIVDEYYSANQTLNDLAKCFPHSCILQNILEVNSLKQKVEIVVKFLKDNPLISEDLLRKEDVNVR